MVHGKCLGVSGYNLKKILYILSEDLFRVDPGEMQHCIFSGSSLFAKVYSFSGKGYLYRLCYISIREHSGSVVECLTRDRGARV